jgi:hypothetical protein
MQPPKTPCFTWLFVGKEKGLVNYQSISAWLQSQVRENKCLTWWSPHIIKMWYELPVKATGERLMQLGV